MLFNSYIFIFLFLPITLLGFHLFGSASRHQASIVWLVAASLFFYGWWNPAYLGLIVSSMLFNYAVGIALSSHSNNRAQKLQRFLLIGGVTANLTLLGYFKYANFFVDNLNALAGSSLTLETIILPLAISFFTFQQIAYLVDAYRGKTREYSFLHYALFVTFFPQLIAGPIVHHQEMLPQFVRNSIYRIRAQHIAIGLSIFAIGLFKKVVLADGIAVYATPVFSAAEHDIYLTFFEAWAGALAYTMQLYFDFSGYSDMAIGLARMFGVRLPLNFNSPYKATSIIDFWRRWHITLSRFLRDYVYIPLGGNQMGEARRMTNVMITMLLGGLWHGAGWTFLIWGGLHGIYIIINYGWQQMRGTWFNGRNTNYLSHILGWILTFFAIVIAWVPFRAESLDGASNMLAAMWMLHGLSLPESAMGRIGFAEVWLQGHGVVFEGMFKNLVLVDFYTGLNWILFLLLIAIVLPNTQQIMRRYRPAFETYHGEIPRLNLRLRWLEWRPAPIWAIFSALLFMLGVLGLSQASEFLYFQF